MTEENKPQDRQCSYCGYTEPLDAKPHVVRKFDGTDQEFCSQSCYEAFGEEVAIARNAATSTVQMTAEEVFKETQNTNEFVRNMPDDRLDAFISQCAWMIENYRLQEQIARVQRAKRAVDVDNGLIRKIRSGQDSKKRQKAMGISPLRKAIKSYAVIMGCSEEDAEKYILSQQKPKQQAELNSETKGEIIQ